MLSLVTNLASIPVPTGIFPNPRIERLKTWTNVIVTGAAIVIAIAGLARAADSGTSEQVYKEMSRQLAVQNQINEHQHQDIMALRQYLDDYLRSSTVVGPRDKGITQPLNPNAPVILIPVDKNRIRVSPGPNSQPVLVLPAGTPPPLPDLNAEPDPFKITEYKDLVDRAEAERALEEKTSKVK